MGVLDNLLGYYSSQVLQIWWLSPFTGSEHGGQTAATLYTLVQSARRNCVDVWPYLTAVLRRIAAIAPGNTAALEELLPDRWPAAHPEHRMEQREEESREAQARRRRKRFARRAAITSRVLATVGWLLANKRV